jgi:drug/metabolite transporter (DMT)-like permease
VAAPDAALTGRLATPGRPAASGALLFATAAWGSTFVVTKSSLGELAPATFLLWRFGVAAVVLLAVSARRTRGLTRPDRWRGVALGVLLGGGFLLQTTGLQDTSAGLSGFLTGSSVVMVPVLASVVLSTRVTAQGWLAVGLSAVGLVLLTSGPGAGFSAGAVLTLAGAAGFAGHITALSAWATPSNAVGITTVSVVVAAGTCAVWSALTGQLAAPRSPGAWAAVLWVALVATCLGLAVQAWAQGALTATSAAVIMTMEPVFAALLAVLVADELLGPAAWLGGLLVVLAMGTAEIGVRECCDATAPRVECC